MRRWTLVAVVTMLLGLGFSASPPSSEGSSQGGPPLVPDAYYVAFNKTVASPADAANHLAKSHGLRIRQVFGLTDSAFSAIVPAGRVNALERDPRVVSVSPIPRAQLFGEVTPTGIDRIDAEVGITATRGNGVDVAVLDSGSGPHSDLVVTSVDVTGDGESPSDFDGHGTHVAGTVAATSYNNKKNKWSETFDSGDGLDTTKPDKVKVCSPAKCVETFAIGGKGR